MPETYFYTSDPGNAALLDKGAVLNVIYTGESRVDFSRGEVVLGLLGAVVNDRGAPNQPIALSGKIDDLRTLYGGFSPYLGDGPSSGYQGNLYARSKGLDAPIVVLQPVDLAIKDATIATGTDILLSVTRSDAAHGAKTIFAGHRFSNRAAGGTLSGTGATIEADDDTVTATGHGLAAGDTVVFSALGGGGAGLSTDTTYYVVSVADANSFTVSASPGGSAIDVTTDYTGVAWSSDAYVVATLEDIAYTESETGSKAVRCRPVSGTPVALDKVDTFIDTAPDANITVNTSAVTLPDAIDAAELQLRYQRALDLLTSNLAGKSINVLVGDRDEADVADAIAAHCAAATGIGYPRIGIVSPPVGTSASAAQGSTGDGVGRSTLTRSRVAYAHPGWRRTLLDDADNLTAPTYLATMPSALALAARTANTQPHKNPARPHQTLRNYGIVGEEPLLPAPVGKTHFAAGIVMPTFDRVGNQLEATFRDGIMADGTKIAFVRKRDDIAEGAIKALGPFHKDVATAKKRQNAVDTVGLFLQSEKDDGKIADFVVSGTWDAPNEHFIVELVVDYTGNLDIITVKLNFGADVVTKEAA